MCPCSRARPTYASSEPTMLTRLKGIRDAM
jgi:hypothetical protein